MFHALVKLFPHRLNRVTKSAAVLEIGHMKMLSFGEVPSGRSSASWSCAMAALLYCCCKLVGFFHTQNFFLGKGFFLSVVFSPQHL